MRWLSLVCVMACSSVGGAGAGASGTQDGSRPDATDLEGTYEVTRWVADEAVGCPGPEVPILAPYPVFEVAVQDLFGVKSLVLYPCLSASSCDGDSYLESLLFESWSDTRADGSLISASHSGGACRLTWVEGTLEAIDGGVRFTTWAYQEEDVPGVDLDDCITQQDNWSGARTCMRVDIVEGVSL